MADSGLLRAIASPSLAPFQQGLATSQGLQDRARSDRARGLAGAALQQGLGGPAGDVAAVDPSLGLRVFDALGVAGGQRQAQFTEDVRIASGLAQQNPQAAVQSVQRAIERNEAAGIPSPEMRQFLQEFVDDPVAGAQNLQLLNQALQTPLQATAGQREFGSITAGFTPEELAQAQRVSAGIAPRAGISATERISVSPELTSQVARSESQIAGAIEGAKLGQQLAFKPQIQKAVKRAEEQSKVEGEAFTDLARAEAALPGLLETVNVLRELAPIATSTLGGRIFDAAIKESGFGATKGSTAKAKFIAIINNQVLPLLKPTFGAAFTVQEGESLKATMGDPDASPAEKLAQLDAFIDQKRKSIETSQRQADAAVEPAQQAVIRFDRQGRRIQ